MDPRKYDDIQIGDKVQILDSNDNLIDIIVAKKLSQVEYHNFGIKVKGTNGEIGRTRFVYPRVTDAQKIINLTNDFEQHLSLDEGENLEFKASMLLDLKHFDDTGEKKIHDKGPHSIAKTIAGFANQHGGTLYVGIKDDTREILGLENDFQLLTYKKNSDGFLMKLKSAMESLLGKSDFYQCITERRILHLKNDKEICIIKVNPSKIPIVVTHNGKNQLYVREGDDSILYENIQSFCIHWYEHMKELDS